MTPAQYAQAHIAQIEKRYKSPRNRIDKVNIEGIFWYDFWKAVGLLDEPEYQEAIRIYSEYWRRYLIGNEVEPCKPL